jgi:hypothetical protein
MKIIYKTLKFDHQNDQVLAVFEDFSGAEFYFSISVHTAESIVRWFDQKSSSRSGILQILLDLIDLNHARLGLLCLENRKGTLSGSVQLKLRDTRYCYSLTADDTVYLSVILNRQIKINPEQLTDFLDQQKEIFYHPSVRLPVMN